MNPLLLDLRHLTKGHGKTPVLKEFFFTMEKGNHRALVGPSGCGKSTVLRLIAGLETPESGQIYIAGQLVTDGPHLLRPPHLRGLAMVFQDLALWPNLTVRENVGMALSAAPMSRMEKRQRIGESLVLCQIDGLAERKPAQLSGGQQQRAALARALAARPALLLLDEPFTGMDATLKSELAADIQAMALDYSMTLLVVTHDQGEAEALGCDSFKMIAEQIPPLDKEGRPVLPASE